eukprot:NODE_23859_length_648_cov_5.694818.p1 GENE.NODE_23859_length_648_cov_5.694818~~NODE_23859_length_648_cov_5.694818.p1  ORF type:complete len:183 (-),score=69.22 NODE_23859_length_648_cov_5.694818:99-593(-)
MTYAGLGPDYRVLLRRARKKAQEYELVHGEPIPIEGLAVEVAAVMQEFTQSGGVRPFGVSLLVAGYDHTGYQLFQVDPSGIYFKWKATAIGKGMSNARGFLEKRYSSEQTIEDAIHNAVLVLKDCYEGELTEKTFELGVAREEDGGKFVVIPEEQLKDYLKEVE